MQARQSNQTTTDTSKEHAVVPPPQESVDNSPNFFDYGLDDPYNDLIDDFDLYLEYGERY